MVAWARRSWASYLAKTDEAEEEEAPSTRTPTVARMRTRRRSRSRRSAARIATHPTSKPSVHPVRPSAPTAESSSKRIPSSRRSNSSRAPAAAFDGGTVRWREFLLLAEAAIRENQEDELAQEEGRRRYLKTSRSRKRKDGWDPNELTTEEALLEVVRTRKISRKINYDAMSALFDDSGDFSTNLLNDKERKTEEGDIGEA